MPGRPSRTDAIRVASRPSKSRIHSFWRLPDISTELQVRRVQEYARWARHLERHSPSLAAVFGQSRLDRNHDTLRISPDFRLVPTSSPWAVRLVSDLRALCYAYYPSDLVAQLDHDIRCFFRPGPTRDQWTAHWLSELATTPSSTADSSSTRSSEEYCPFVCVFDGQSYCTASFERYHAMVRQSMRYECVCVWCMSVLASRPTSGPHMLRSARTGR
jgi:hypothetical protein